MPRPPEFEYYPAAILEAGAAFEWYANRSQQAADGFLVTVHALKTMEPQRTRRITRLLAEWIKLSQTSEAYSQLPGKLLNPMLRAPL